MLLVWSISMYLWVSWVLSDLPSRRLEPTCMFVHTDLADLIRILGHWSHKSTEPFKIVLDTRCLQTGLFKIPVASHKDFKLLPPYTIPDNFHLPLTWNLVIITNETLTYIASSQPFKNGKIEIIGLHFLSRKWPSAVHRPRNDSKWLPQK